MKYTEVIKDLNQQIRSERLRMAAIAGAILIGMLFALLSVYAFWNPAKHMEELEVPVVILDRGAERDGEAVNFGENIADQLEENDSMNWKIYHENIFVDGIENTEYFFGFIIPENFSQSILDAPDDPSDKVDIIFVSDARKNFLMSQMSGNVRNAFSQTVAQSISEEYAKALYAGLDEAADGMIKAAEGSSQISEGIGHTKEGADQITFGAQKLEDGAASLTDGLGELSDGADDLKTGASALSGGVDKLAESSAGFSEGVSDAKDQTDQAFDAYLTGVSEYTGGYVAIYQGIKGSGLWNMIPEEQRAVLTALFEKSEELNTGGTKLKEGIDDGFDQIITSADKLHGGTETLADNAEKLSKGAGKLSNGASSAKAGSEQLEKGSGDLASGASSLSAGQEELLEGSKTLTESLEDGSDSIREAEGDNTQQMAQFISDPLETEQNVYGKTDHYGLGLAPMFLSLGLWIGSLILFFAIPLRPRREVSAGRIASVFGSLTSFLMYDLLVATAIGLGAVFLVGIEPQSVAMFFLWAMFCGTVFLSILHMLHVVFGELPGKAVGILFIVFQIATSGGAIAPQLEVPTLQAISPLFPMRYSIDGFREILFGGNYMNLMLDLCPLMVWIVISLLLTFACWNRTATR